MSLEKRFECLIEGGRIREEALRSAKRLVDKIPREQLQLTTLTIGDNPYGQPYYRFKLSETAIFTTTKDEKYLMQVEAKRYNGLHDGNPLIAHGTKSAYHLCQILLEGQLYHKLVTEHYGSLSAELGSGVDSNGYYDNGWGLFVAKRNTVSDSPLITTQSQRVRIVQLNEHEGIVVPTQIAPLLREEFPDLSKLIFGYQGFASRIRTLK